MYMMLYKKDKKNLKIIVTKRITIKMVISHVITCNLFVLIFPRT